LHRVSRAEGYRAPTPAQLAGVAVSTQGTGDLGMKPEEMWPVLRQFGFPPHVFSGERAPSIFALLLNVYLRSGIPVVICLKGTKGEDGHAVTAVGYRQLRKKSQEFVLRPEAVKPLKADLEFRNLRFDELYVHDDRMGPYARAYARASHGITLEIEWPAALRRPADSRRVLEAAAPLYNKLRTNAAELYAAALLIAPTIRDMIVGKSIGVEMFFEQGGKYLRNLLVQSDDADAFLKFATTIPTSRYIGVVRWWASEIPLLDVIFDTTDRIRKETLESQIVGIAALNPSFHASAHMIAGRFGAAVF
jgi:hypothetical protein